AVYRVDVGDRFDVDLAVEVEGEVGEALGGGAKVGVAGQRLVEERRGDFGVAEHRAGRAAPGGEIDPGADVPDVSVVEQLVGWQGARNRGGVCFSGCGGDPGVDRRVAKAVHSAGQLQGELGVEGQGAAVGDLEVGTRSGHAA